MPRSVLELERELSTEENAEVSVGNWCLFISGRSSIITNVRLWSDFRPAHGRPTTAVEGKLFQEQEINFFFSALFAIFLSFSSQHWFTVFPTTSQEELSFSGRYNYNISWELAVCMWELLNALAADLNLWGILGILRWNENERIFFSSLMRIFHFHSTRAESRRSSAWSQQPQTMSRFFLSFSNTRVQQHNCALCV